jgi:hypothetical protein
MDGIFFLSSVIAAGLVMWWVIRNDAAGLGSDTFGFFAMK